MDVSLAATLNVVRQFIGIKKGAKAQNIEADTPLLRDGYIDSFGLVELIGELERSLHISLPDGALIPEDFETPRVLFDRLQEL